MSGKISVSFNVNGRARRVKVPPMKRLLDVLREDCALPGSKEGCGEGECGACSVLLDGRSVNSCLVPAAQAEGTRIVTVEGLAKGTRLNALQQAFVDLGGAQCGICTPGMLVTATELLARARGRVPSDSEVRDALAGNLCRCTGYQKIIDAVRAAARSAQPKRASARRKTATKPRRAASKRSRTASKPRRAAPKSRRAAPKQKKRK